MTSPDRIAVTQQVMEVDTSLEEARRQSSISFNKESEGKEGVEPTSPSPKVPKKFINNWKQACDRTKDRTKELLKKWRTVPDTGPVSGADNTSGSGTGDQSAATGNGTNWTEHVWATWVKRNTSADEEVKMDYEMTEVQRKRFVYFFVSYLDLDRDDFISLADFDAFAERLRHFSDWSKNSTEYHRLQEVQKGFVQTFLLPCDQVTTIHSYDELEKKIRKEQLSVEQWTEKWAAVLAKGQSFSELPYWLQYFPKLLFHAINKSGTGRITRDELSAFYSSLLSLTSVQMTPFVDEAYNALTSNKQHQLTYSVYRLCFANFLFARHPNGPGEYIFGPVTCGQDKCSFPIDYRMLKTAPSELEQYSPKIKSNRKSIIV